MLIVRVQFRGNDRNQHIQPNQHPSDTFILPLSYFLAELRIILNSILRIGLICFLAEHYAD